LVRGGSPTETRETRKPRFIPATDEDIVLKVAEQRVADRSVLDRREIHIGEHSRADAVKSGLQGGAAGRGFWPISR
jgi:hypothetical protein